MENIRTWTLITLIATLAFACKPIEKIPLGEVPKLVSMEKGESRARYPVYEITVHNNQIAEYRGKRNTPKLGTWVKELSDEEFSKIQDQLKRTNIWQYPSFVRSNIPDLPLVTITQFDGTAQKSVTGKEGRPAPIMALEQSLETLANQEGWVLKQSFDFGLPSNVNPSQIRIELKPGIYINNWIYRYIREEMQILAELPEKSNYWLVSYNPTVAFPREMESMLERDEQVANFQFNPRK
jgi:hypothetical protein